MAILKKEPSIVRKIKKEVATEKARIKQDCVVTAKNAVISGDLGCSDSGGCSNYCSES